MLGRPAIYDGAILRPWNQGDLMDTRELIATLTTAGAGVILAAAMSQGILSRTGPGGGFADTFDTANNIVAAFISNVATAGPSVPGFYPSPPPVTFGTLYLVSNQPQQGATYRWLYINGVAFAMTAAVTANTGVILGANVNVASSLWREYLITLVNTTSQQSFNAATTNASTVVTGLTTAQTSLITPGMTVASAGNITAGTTVASIQAGVGVTLSANALATTNPAALVFMPTVSILGLRSGTA